MQHGLLYYSAKASVLHIAYADAGTVGISVHLNLVFKAHTAQQTVQCPPIGGILVRSPPTSAYW